MKCDSELFTVTSRDALVFGSRATGAGCASNY